MRERHAEPGATDSFTPSSALSGSSTRLIEQILFPALVLWEYLYCFTRAEFLVVFIGKMRMNALHVSPRSDPSTDLTSTPGCFVSPVDTTR